MIVHTISEYLSLRYKRENITTKIVGGRMLYFHEGKWIGEDEYNKLYPKPSYYKTPKSYGDNPDKRNLFINDKKSY